MIDILGNEAAKYEEGADVIFDINGTTKGTGKIRGLASEGLINLWIVEVVQAEGIAPAMYPWTCLVVPHTLLKRA